MKFLVLWAALIAAAVTTCAPALAQTAAGVGAALTAPDKTAVTLSGVLVTSADANSAAWSCEKALTPLLRSKFSPPSASLAFSGTSPWTLRDI